MPADRDVPDEAIGLTILTCLVRIFTDFRSQQWFAESLKAGLLLGVFSCGSRVNRWDTDGHIIRLLRDFLPAFTVYFSVLSQLRISLAEVQGLDPASSFNQLELEQWERFVELVDERFQLVEEYNYGTWTALRACDNFEVRFRSWIEALSHHAKCGHICDKRQLKRCSQCCIRFYCSRSCQKSDWRNIHRTHCQTLQQRQLGHRIVLHLRLSAYQ
ncbi:hypothetical protein GGX14DRAFT_372655 [Mycena pura]|uniref:MYND-type domain-containing protein n=1 Tax=Mycena pura TaxID=153505 RepID=A0AAD6V0V9_9AGAR|nr:hypothetical protein GGX14DRAFT_372655 [Mycena pura]